MDSQGVIRFIQELYSTKGPIPLHVPRFCGNEKKYVIDTIDSTFVSSVGEFVNKFEREIESFTLSKRAVATTNGTAALHISMHAAGVQAGDLVITQALTFVATCNAIAQLGASPVFIDISEKSLGLDPRVLDEWLEDNCAIDDNGATFHKESKKRVRAVVPMHTFGHPVELDELVAVTEKWNLFLIEDAAESLGSYYKGRHTGTVGALGALSFNGNKIITTGGGGIVLAQTSELGERIKHLTTTAKVPHQYEFNHDEVGFNYRLPNINAALGCAQLESLEQFINEKRVIASLYDDFFKGSRYSFVKEPKYAKSNYWLNAIVCEDMASRNELLDNTNKLGVMTRPSWTLMHKLPMYQHALKSDLSKSEWYSDRIVNLPSSVRT